MLGKMTMAGGLAAVLIMATMTGSAHAAPGATPQALDAGGITLVKSGGFGSRGGFGGRSFGGFGGGGAKFGGGPRFGGGKFFGGGPRFRDGGPRFSYRRFDGPKNWYGRKFSHNFRHKRHRRFHGFAFYGAPYLYAYSGGYGCRWLYRRAIVTGSPYWWNRYYACRDGYYDY